MGLDLPPLRRFAELARDSANLPDTLADAAVQTFSEQITPAVVVELIEMIQLLAETEITGAVQYLGIPEEQRDLFTAWASQNTGTIYPPPGADVAADQAYAALSAERTRTIEKTLRSARARLGYEQLNVPFVELAELIARDLTQAQ